MREINTITLRTEQKAIIQPMPQILSVVFTINKKYSKKLTNVVSLVFDREKFKLDAGLKYQNVILGTNQIFLPNNVVDNNTVWKEK